MGEIPTERRLMEWDTLLLATVTTSTRVFAACLLVGLGINLLFLHFDRKSKRLPPRLATVLTLVAWIAIIAAGVCLSFSPFD